MSVSDIDDRDHGNAAHLQPIRSDGKGVHSEILELESLGSSRQLCRRTQKLLTLDVAVNLVLGLVIVVSSSADVLAMKEQEVGCRKETQIQLVKRHLELARAAH